MSRNIVFILNPNAKSGLGIYQWNEVAACLAQRGLCVDKDYELYVTKTSGDATRYAHKVSSASEVVSGEKELVLGVIGGDGTLDEVVNGISCFKHTTILYIPAGSGNDFARSTGGHISPERVVDILLDENAKVNVYDIGYMEAIRPVRTIRAFAESAGIGYDAQVCRDIRFSKLKLFFNRLKIGSFAYTILGAAAILKSRPCGGWIEADGKKMSFDRFWFASVHIHPYEGGGFMFAPEADSNDGLLDVCLVSGINKAQFVLVLFKTLIKKHGNENGVRILHCKKCKIHVNRPKQTHCDGELMGIQNDVAYVARSRKLRVFAPVIGEDI